MKSLAALVLFGATSAYGVSERYECDATIFDGNSSEYYYSLHGMGDFSRRGRFRGFDPLGVVSVSKTNLETGVTQYFLSRSKTESVEDFDRQIVTYRVPASIYGLNFILDVRGNGMRVVHNLTQDVTIQGEGYCKIVDPR